MSRLNYESAHNKSNKMPKRASIDTQIREPTCPGNADIADIGISVKEPCTSWQYQQMTGYVFIGTQIIHGPDHGKAYKITNASSHDSDQPDVLRPIRVCAVQQKKS